MPLKGVVAFVAGFFCVATAGLASPLLNWNWAGTAIESAGDVTSTSSTELFQALGNDFPDVVLPDVDLSAPADNDLGAPTGALTGYSLDSGADILPRENESGTLPAVIIFSPGVGPSTGPPNGTTPIAQIPEPLTLTLLGSGLFAAAVWIKRRTAPGQP